MSELNESGSTNLIDALKNVPGVSQITTGAGISKPTIRGLGYNRVISLYNGIRQEGQQWGDEHGIEIDEYAIDRIEIVKGPGSLMYGSDGIAGVLNFISPIYNEFGPAQIDFQGLAAVPKVYTLAVPGVTLPVTVTSPLIEPPAVANLVFALS